MAPPKFCASSSLLFVVMLDARQESSLQQFEKQSSRYGRAHILSDTADLEELFAHSPVRSGTALDVATGGGHTACFLAAKGFSVTASDLSPAMLANTQKLTAENGVSVATSQHPAEEFPWPDQSMDLVACRVAAHHFSKVNAFLSETHRVLRPGGVLLLIDGSVPDGQPEVAEWLHQVEKLRDPSHGRLLAPEEWKSLCAEAGLEVLHAVTTPFKQPDLNWYFKTADTSEENRRQVLELIDQAPESVREALGLTLEEDRVVWWWPRLSLLAQKPVS